MRRMKELLEEAMKQGCAGLSTGLFYPPSGYADLVLFDKEKIGDEADFVHCNLLCAGIEKVFVGGKIVYQDGAMTDECPGTWIGSVWNQES